jgi:hypothetical protein
MQATSATTIVKAAVHAAIRNCPRLPTPAEARAILASVLD